MHKVEFCCCGCSLRGGTLILLVLDVMWCFICLLFSLNNGFTSFLISAALMAIPVAGMYGIFKGKPEFLIAFMAVQLFAFFVMVIIMVVLLVGGSAVVNEVMKMAGTPEDKQNVVNTGFIVILLYELILGFFTGLQYYFFVVVFSLYRKMKEGGSMGFNNNF